MAEFNPLDPNAPALMDLSQQRKLADLLTQQGLQQPQGQMVSGQYVKASPLQYFANLANLYAGQKTGEEATKKAEDYARALRLGKNVAEEQIIKAMSPQEAKITELAGPAYKGKAPVAYQPPTEPNWAEAARLIRTNEYGAGKEMLPQVLKNLAPETPASILEFQYGKKNPEYFNYQTNLKKAGANQFNFTDILGKDIGQIKDLLTASQNRVQQGELSKNAANKIEGAINSGNLNVGPGATVGQSLGQIGDALGLVNQKGQEKLVNTRSAVQGLAQMWAASRAQAKGQGAMDQKESELYGKISSGNIDSLSLPELKYIVDQTKSQGNYFRSEHDRLLNELRKDPKLKNIVPFYDVGYMPTVSPTNTGNAKSNGVSYLGPVE